MATSPTERISEIRTQIHTNISQVYANQSQCQRLSARIDQLIDPLERLEHAPSSLLRPETRPLLDSLLQCLDDCNHHIEKFISPTQWYQEVYEHQDDHQKFEELNKRLSQLGHDLSLGLNIQQIFDRQHDQDDRRQDLQDLTQKLNEISQQMLQQQQNQYKLMDKMIDRRFQSIRYHLAQHLLMQQESTEARDLVAEYEQFLHIPYKDLYIEEKPIGGGGFSDVYKATWLTHHDSVAVKVIRIHHLSGDSRSGVRADFYHEISTMYRIRYENVLTVLGACIEPNFYAIIVEHMPLGSLHDVLHGKNGQDQMITLSWPDRYSLVWQMAKSINYLHNLNPCILHRDIKSMNFLLKQDGSGNHRFIVKVCDFGLAEIRRESFSQSTMNSSSASSQNVGSLAWKAPELLAAHGRHTKQSDVYSLGIVWWELATARKPWDEYADEIVILIQIRAGERPKIPLDVPEEYKQWMQDAWNHDPHKRPTCFELMERIYKQMTEKKEGDHSTVPSEQNDDIMTLAVDLHRRPVTTQRPDSFISTTDTEFSSTKTSVQVVEEKEEEKRRLTKRLSKSIISEYRQDEAAGESKETKTAAIGE
jgi:serine/threonine protein kinase